MNDLGRHALPGVVQQQDQELARGPPVTGHMSPRRSSVSSVSSVVEMPLGVPPPHGRLPLVTTEVTEDRSTGRDDTATSRERG
jgi:hypothetical protein